MNAPPQVSIVIPTHGRPQYLPRAVQSALACQADSVEVLVVPNGPDTGWRDALRPWHADRRVRVAPLETKGVSAARNHGMSLACGTYLRFLDDDDYLLPAARAQLALIEHTQADVCSGLLSNIDEDGVDGGVNSAPASNDFVSAVAAITGFRLPHGNLWRRSAISDCGWDPAIHEGEDYAWTLDLAAAREWQWVRIDSPVGIWFQHRGPRGSSVRRPTNRKEGVISHLVGLHQRLSISQRLTIERSSAIADALWYFAHIGFPSHPVYWSHIAQQALAIDPTSRPPERFFTDGPFRDLNPVLGEWALLPARRVTRVVHDAPQWWRNPDYRRKL